MTMAMTVLGPVQGSELGVVMPHEHLTCNAVRIDPDLILNDVELVIDEARLLRAAGGGTIVEVSSQGLGRNPGVLQRIARETSLNVIMGSAWYHERVYPPHLARLTVNEIADQIVNDIVIGVADTGIRSGIIGEVGCAADFVSPVEERVLRAAARAQTRTGLAIITHGDFSPIGLLQLDIFAEERADLRRVIVSHCDSCPESDYHLAVARRGAFVEFDLVRGANEWETKRHVRWLTALWQEGYGAQILLSQDVCKPRHLHAYGGFGYDYLLREFVPQLAAAGFTNEQIEVMLVVNPRRALVGDLD